MSARMSNPAAVLPKTSRALDIAFAGEVLPQIINKEIRTTAIDLQGLILSCNLDRREFFRTELTSGPVDENSVIPCRIMKLRERPSIGPQLVPPGMRAHDGGGQMKNLPHDKGRK